MNDNLLNSTITNLFLESFCESYQKYFSVIEEYSLLNRNINPKNMSLSPSTFLADHQQFETKILAGDRSVLSELNYLGRRRLSTISPKNLDNLLLHLSNLYTLAKFATKEYSELTEEDRVLATNILGEMEKSHAPTQIIDSNTLLSEVMDDIQTVMTPDMIEMLRGKLVTEGGVNGMMKNLMTMVDSNGNLDKSQLGDGFTDLVASISDKVVGRIESGEIDEKALVTTMMTMMSKSELGGPSI